MNTKTSWLLLLILIASIFFVPLIPNDNELVCDTDSLYTCDDSVGYISLYKKYFK